MIGFNMKPYSDHLQFKAYSESLKVTGGSLRAKTILPDIYYIVADSYTSSASLNKYWNFDNSAFIEGLKTRGFYVAEKSRAFATDTVYSMVSALNMLNDRELLVCPEQIVLELIKNNNVVKYLQHNSYEIINLSPFELAGIPKKYNDFETVEGPFFYYQKLFKGSIFCQFIISIVQSNVYKVNFNILSTLENIAGTKEDVPKFIYAHLMMPHGPYCFDHNGNFIPLLKRKLNFDKDAYLEQLVFTNKLLLDCIDKILFLSKRAPIIIIQGDHGFRYLKDMDEKENESFTILNAYYVSQGCKNLLYPSIAPYNTFRIIFNYYFGADFTPFKDDAS